MARHEPPDHSRGDEKTLGGYMAVHSRPAAFEGADGRSYTVAIETDETGERARPVGGYLLFVRWGGEQPEVTGHIESPFLAWGATAEEATRAVGPEHTVWSSDLGQNFNPPVEDGLALMADRFLAAGFSEDDVRTMAVTNTRRVAGLAGAPATIGA